MTMVTGHPLTDVGAHSAMSNIASLCWADRASKFDGRAMVECNTPTAHPSGLCQEHCQEILGNLNEFSPYGWHTADGR